jgi:HK97 family phage portal protein
MLTRLRAWVFSKSAPRGMEEVFRELFLVASKSGINVNWKTALEATSALACARVIAEGLAQVPFRLFQKTDNMRMPAESHPLYGLLNDGPNEWQTSFEFFEQMGLHLVFCNNFFAFKNVVGGKVVELLPYEPQHVTVDRTGWELRYKIATDEGKFLDIPASSMWHVRGPSWNGWMGLNGVKLAREAIGLALATEEHGARLFKNGATVGGILSTDQDLGPEKRAELRESWISRQAGSSNAFSTAVLWGGLKWQPMGTPNDQAQFLETRKFQVEEICRAFRVMPIMIGYSDKTSTYASAEQMFLAHVVHTMGPWYRRIEKSADKNLLTEKDRQDGHYTKFIDKALLRGAVKDRGDYYTKMYGIGAMNPNEIRELEEMNPYDGGDKYRVPLNMQDPLAPEPTKEEGDNAKA